MLWNERLEKVSHFSTSDNSLYNEMITKINNSVVKQFCLKPSINWNNSSLGFIVLKKKLLIKTKTKFNAFVIYFLSVNW